MHSKKKIKQEYPGIARSALLQIYTGTFAHKPNLANNVTLVEQLKSITYDEFLKKTSANMAQG